MPLYRAVPILDALPVAEEAPASGENAVQDALPVDESAIVEALLVALPVALPAKDILPPPNLFVRFFRLIGWVLWTIASGLEWLFGAAVLMGGLAFLAALPVVQFLSLGYLLEAGARVARSGRLREAFIGVRLAARLGGIVLGSWLLLLPVRLVSGMTRSAQVIDPGGPVARGWRIGLLVLIAFTALHIGLACARGGRLRYFVWPFNFVWFLRRLWRGGYYTEARDAVWDTVMALRATYYFWLGLRGFLGALVWLVLPVSLLALGQVQIPVAPLFGVVGALQLGVVLLFLPFLQMRMAEQNRFSAMFDLGGMQNDYLRAPWAFALAFVVTLLSAVPLYLLKIELVPREAAWLPSLVFVMFIFPARVLTGWALARARRREEPRHWFFRWTGRLPLLPAVAFYVLIVYFTQYTSWNGVWSLYEQHAFLVPVPFFGG